MAAVLATSQQHIHEFACKGLRTLVVASRKLTHDEWTTFDREFQAIGMAAELLRDISLTI
jgi:magnesium-transporting ATPase (P-type)